MGRSGKPDIEYRFVDHVRYLDAFIDALGLDEIVLVAQDWGTALAFHYAARRPQRMLGLAFMEFIQPNADLGGVSSAAAGSRAVQGIQDAGAGRAADPGGERVHRARRSRTRSLRKLSEEEMAAYRAPFPTPASRKPILRFPRELPIAGEPPDVYAMIEQDHAALRTSDISQALVLRRSRRPDLAELGGSLRGALAQLPPDQARRRRALSPGGPPRRDRVGVERLDREHRRARRATSAGELEPDHTGRSCGITAADVPLCQADRRPPVRGKG